MRGRVLPLVPVPHLMKLPTPRSRCAGHDVPHSRSGIRRVPADVTRDRSVAIIGIGLGLTSHAARSGSTSSAGTSWRPRGLLPQSTVRGRQRPVDSRQIGRTLSPGDEDEEAMKRRFLCREVPGVMICASLEPGSMEGPWRSVFGP